MKRLSVFMLLVLNSVLCFAFSCISPKKCENCKIEKIVDIVVKNDEFYYVKVKFNHCKSKENRIFLVRNELINKFPTIKNKTLQVEEYLGKKYNEYLYEINIKTE